MTIAVPPGTIVREEESGAYLGELVAHGDVLRVAREGDEVVPRRGSGRSVWLLTPWPPSRRTAHSIP